MALQSSGAISLNDINIEFARGSGTSISLSQLYRGGGIVGSNNTNVPASGAISLNNFYGASRRVTASYSLTAGTSYASPVTVNNSNITGYVAGLTDTTIFIPSNTVVNGSGGYSALNITGFTTGDTVNIVNNGTISGYGGSGSQNGDAGGTALDLSGMGASVAYVTNNGVISGGGGGGGQGEGQSITYPYGYGSATDRSKGGGGGGGAAGHYSGTYGNGGSFVPGPVATPVAAYYSSGTNGSAGYNSGSFPYGGAKGLGSYGHWYAVAPNYYVRGGDGGAGGGRGASGAAGKKTEYSGENWGGPYTFNTGPMPFPWVSGVTLSLATNSGLGSGGAAGNAIRGTGKLATPVANNGSIYGPQVA